MLRSTHRRQAADASAVLAAIAKSQAMITFGLDGTILNANAMFLDTMDYALEDVVGHHHAMFMPPGEQETPAYQQFWAALRQGKYQAAVFRRIARGGREVWLQASYSPVLDAAGKPFSVVKVASDVTKARLQSADFAGQVEAINRSEAVVEFTPEGTILTANDHFLQCMGYTLAEIAGRHHEMFVTPEERAGTAYQAFWADLKRGAYRSGQFKRLAKDGREIWLQASYNPILGPDNTTFKVVKFGTDITAARIESADHKGQIDAINRAQAVIEFTLEGTIMAANENFLRCMGYALAEIVGRHHSMFVPPAVRDSPDYAAFWAGLRAGELKTGEFERVSKQGKTVCLRASYNPIYDPDGRLLKVVKFASDVTGQVQARRRFMELIDGVAGAAEQLNLSITEISSTMSRSQHTAEDAVQRVAAADEATQRLNDAAQKMGRVVELINKIAQQINLLALNATIESARAGDAGRGFAVVANEVKNLANQAKTATDEIAREINGIRGVSGEVVGALAQIKQAIGSVSSFVTSTAVAVEQQGAMTATISTSMHSAAEQASNMVAA